MKQKIQKTEEQIFKNKVRRRTILSFSVFLVMILGGVLAWNWLYSLNPYQPGEGDAGARKPVRSAFEKNENIFSSFFNSNRISKRYPIEKAAKNVRVNGSLGLEGDNDTTNWKLHIVRNAGDTLFVTLKDIKALPKTEEIFDFKCIEGWDQVTHWGGVRLSDFIKHYGLDKQARMAYISLSTPDKEYYVGIDMASALHAQTLLCYEMNGMPLPVEQGYPLRLIIPVKYGIKHLKRIGTIYFSDTKPPDYWAERGYDYYSGL